MINSSRNLLKSSRFLGFLFGEMEVMTSVDTTVSISWTPEDDLLLKNAVEAGASLEALAKGALQFSRRYTLQQLQDRWRSLLYDSDIAPQASARMVELELSGFNPLSKFNRFENSKGSKDVHGKRKVDSIRKKYYTMRKKFRSEFFNSTDLGFLDEPNLNDCSGQAADFQHHVMLAAKARDDNCMSDDRGLQDPDLDIVFPEALGDIPVSSAFANSHASYNAGCPNSVEANNPNGILRKSRFPEDFTASLREEGRNSFQPVIEDREFPDALKESLVNFGKHLGVKESCPPQLSPDGKVFSSPEGKQLSTFHSRSDNAHNISCGFGSREHFHSPKSGTMLGVRPDSSDFIYASAASDGEFTDLPDSLLNLSNEDDILLMEVDGKDPVDNLCTDNCKLIPSCPSDILEGGSDGHESEVVALPNTTFAVAGDSKHLGSEVNASSVHQGIRCDFEVNVPSTPASNPDSKLSDGNVCCTLNTEDPEIPCNDDIFLLIHPSLSFASSATQPIHTGSMDLPSTSNLKETERRVSSFTRGNDSAKSFNWIQKVGVNISGEKRPVQPAMGCSAQPKVPGTSALPLPLGDSINGFGDTGQRRTLPAISKKSPDGVRREDVARVGGVGDTPATLLKMPQLAEPSSVAVVELAVNPSVSEMEEPQSDDDVPYFSDVEAVILETDLDSHDQDLFITTQVSRYQFEDSKRTFIRLEQCALSSMQRAMTSQGAFAILYGRHLRHYIRKTEVILGRSTDDVEVDVDLRLEGRANKISRHQATIKMESNGFFRLKNLGKYSIMVNGKSVDTGQLLTLSPSCQIEIQGMSFAFVMNRKYVRQYLDSINQKNKGISKFEWAPEGKP